MTSVVDATLLVQRGMFVSPVRRRGADLDFSENASIVGGLGFSGMILSWWLAGKTNEDLTSKLLWLARRNELLRLVSNKEQRVAVSLKHCIPLAADLVGRNHCSEVVATEARVVLCFVDVSSLGL